MNYTNKHPFNIALLSALFLFLSCTGNNKQQNATTPAENAPKIANEAAVDSQTIETTAQENHPLTDANTVVETTTEKETDDDDRTYYFKDLAEMDQTPTMKGNPKEYFRKNNKFKDWDADDPKKVLLEYIVEKNGTASNIEIKKSSGNKELDDEAFRLIKEAVYLPGTNLDGKPIRCGNTMIYVFFPPQ